MEPQKNEIQAIPQSAVIPALSEQKLKDFLDIAGVATQLTPQERKNFVEIAQAYQLNPFKREIYCTTYGQGQYRKTSIIAGYEVYIKRAERTGKLDGWELKINGAKEDMSAVITIYRKDWSRPFVHEVFFAEAAQKTRDGVLNSIWAKMPRFMLRKVAIAQGFRLCFSDELGGMPYTADELPQGEVKGNKGVSEAVSPEIVDNAKFELPADVLETLESATSKAELKALCRKIAEEDPTFKPALSEYYRNAKLQG